MPHVLLLDPDVVFAHALRTYLRALGYEATSAEPVGQAAACPQCASCTPDAVVVGLTRDGHGAGALALVRTLPPSTPVVLLTTDIGLTSVGRLLAQANVFVVLTKPVLVSEVEGYLRAIAATRSERLVAAHLGA